MGNHYDNWITTAALHGISEFKASRMQQADDANAKDEAEIKSLNASATTKDFLRAFKENRGKDAPVAFQDQEEMLIAMSDPLYDTSESYRQAVAELMRNTPAEVIGVSITSKDASGNTMTLGRQPVSEVATKESMLENAYRDMVIEEMGKLDLSTAKGRYQHMAMLADPANAATLAYMEGLVTSDETKTMNAMLADQAAGHIDRAVTPVTNPIDMPEGSVVYQERTNGN